MIDRTKRKTLKNIGTLAAGGVAASVSTGAFAGALLDTSESLSEDVQLRVHTRVSVLTNDIEVVIRNVGSDTANITELTPSETVTKRGRFNFNELMKHGDLTIQPGQSVSVQMTPHPVVIDASAVTARAESLTEALKRSMTARNHDQNIPVRVMDASLFA